MMRVSLEGCYKMSNEMHIFSPWVHLYDDHLAELDSYPDSINRKAYLLLDGVQCKEWFPDDVAFSMDESEGMVADSIPNSLRLFIITEKVKTILEKSISEEVEYLSVKILDHEKNVIESNYYIANFLTVLPCMDSKKSDYVMSSIVKTQVHHFKHLFLDTAKIPKGTKVFRLGEQTRLVLVRQDLAKLLLDAGCTGMDFINIKDYGKQYRPIDRLALARSLNNT